MLNTTWQMMLVAIAGWVNEQQLAVIEYLKEENPYGANTRRMNPGDSQGAVGPRPVQRIVKALANRAQIESEVTPHVLRHSFACLYIQKGGTLPALMKILGHDRITTTQIYLNLTDAQMQEEYEAKW